MTLRGLFFCVFTILQQCYSHHLYKNTAVGNTIGLYNTAIGNTNGTYNVAIGFYYKKTVAVKV